MKKVVVIEPDFPFLYTKHMTSALNHCSKGWVLVDRKDFATMCSYGICYSSILTWEVPDPPAPPKNNHFTEE